MLRRQFRAGWLFLLLAALFWVACDSDNTPGSQGEPQDGDLSDGDGDGDSDGDDDTDPIPGEPDGDDGDNEPDGDGDDSEPDGDGREDGDSPWELPYLPPDRPGTYRVGAISVRFVSESQERDLPGTVWFPTEANEGERMYYQDLIPATNVIKNAPIADGGPFPVVIFSHGNQGFAEQSGYLTEFLASHGFIVAACDHIGNTTGTFKKELMAYIAQQRPRDLSIVLDHLEAWQQTEGHPLAGKFDLDRVAGAGHSFGGYTVLYWAGASLHREHLEEVCEEGVTRGFCSLMTDDFSESLDYSASVSDARVKAIIPLAPAGWAVFGPEGIGDVFAPTHLQVGDQDETLPPEEESLAMYPHLKAPKSMMVLAGGGHFTFSNMCDIYPRFDGCGAEFLDAQRAYYLSNLYALAFLRVTLLDEARDKEYLTDDFAATHPELTWFCDWE